MLTFTIETNFFPFTISARVILFKTTKTEIMTFQIFFFGYWIGVSTEHLTSFSCEFCEISKNTFFTEHLWWLLVTCFSCL